MPKEGWARHDNDKDVKVCFLMTCVVSLCSQLRFDRYEAAVQFITSQGGVEDIPSQPATQLLLELLTPLLSGKTDKGKSGIIGIRNSCSIFAC